MNHPESSVVAGEEAKPLQVAEKPRFNGSDYDHERDAPRLTKQLERVFALMKDGSWRSLNVIAAVTKDPEASISAQLRHLRKERFGAHGVEKRYRGFGLYEYRLVLNRKDLFE